MVPSWTETLIESGVDVVGRTRYCIHPPQAQSIPIVGGTKDIDWAKVAALNADLLLLDKEENPQKMALASPVPIHATHVTNVKSVGVELQKLAVVLGSSQLNELSLRWQLIEAKGRVLGGRPGELTPALAAAIPGVKEWWRAPSSSVENILYLIWKRPWMVAAADTFIGSVLAHLGYGNWLVASPDQRYPKIDLNTYSVEKTLLLFSSEPYAFLREKSELLALGYPCAYVDGEQFSWFGTRSLKFLEFQQN